MTTSSIATRSRDCMTGASSLIFRSRGILIPSRLAHEITRPHTDPRLGVDAQGVTPAAARSRHFWDAPRDSDSTDRTFRGRDRVGAAFAGHSYSHGRFAQVRTRRAPPGGRRKLGAPRSRAIAFLGHAGPQAWSGAHGHRYRCAA